MADINHVQKLMEDVAAWNQWRSENPGTSIELGKADLRDADLSNANLREAQLVGSNLCGAVLDNADLSSAVLQGANLTSARLHAASFRGASMTRATLNEVEASDADFREADFTGAVSTKADFMGANLSKAICKDSTFVEANFTQSDLTRTDFRDSNLTNASFAEASLEGADLRRSKLDEVSFKSSNLTIANLVRASLVHADFDGANLKHADLRRVVGLSCDQLTKAQNWEVTYRDATLACDATIPDPNRGVTIEVPAANLTLTGHAPTVDVTSTPNGRVRLSDPYSGKGRVGQAIIRHRNEILEQAPALKEAADEILAKYERDIPNDEATQDFVAKLRDLSTGIDEYVLALETEPTEAEAEDAGLSLFQKAMSCIEALEKTGTGDRLSRLAVCTALLGVAAISAPIITPYISFPLMTACVFPEETGKAVSLFKELSRKLGVTLGKLRLGEDDKVDPED